MESLGRAHWKKGREQECSRLSFGKMVTRGRYSGVHLISYWDLWGGVGDGKEAADMTGTC